jgi:hypothetical protein
MIPVAELCHVYESGEVMRILLRVRSGYYYQSRSEWCLEPSEAFDFLHTTQALEAAHCDKRADMEVVMHFGEPQFDVCLPVNWTFERRMATSKAS